MEESKKYLIINGEEFELQNMYDKPNCLGVVETIRGLRRETINIRLNISYEELKSKVSDNMTWGIKEQQVDGEGETSDVYFDYSLEFPLVCFIGSWYDDNSSLLVMGKKTDSELQGELINDLLGV